MATIVAGTVGAVASASQIISGAYELSCRLVDLVRPQNCHLDSAEVHFLFCIQRQIESMIRPLEFCVLWSRNRDPITQQTIWMVEDTLRRVWNRIRCLEVYHRNVEVGTIRSISLDHMIIPNEHVIVPGHEQTVCPPTMTRSHSRHHYSSRASRFHHRCSNSPSMMLTNSKKVKSLNCGGSSGSTTLLRWCVDELNIAASQLTLALATVQAHCLARLEQQNVEWSLNCERQLGVHDIKGIKGKECFRREGGSKRSRHIRRRFYPKHFKQRTKDSQSLRISKDDKFLRFHPNRYSISASTLVKSTFQLWNMQNRTGDLCLSSGCLLLYGPKDDLYCVSPSNRMTNQNESLNAGGEAYQKKDDGLSSNCVDASINRNLLSKDCIPDNITSKYKDSLEWIPVYNKCFLRITKILQEGITSTIIAIEPICTPTTSCSVKTVTPGLAESTDRHRHSLSKPGDCNHSSISYQTHDHCRDLILPSYPTDSPDYLLRGRSSNTTVPNPLPSPELISSPYSSIQSKPTNSNLSNQAQFPTNSGVLTSSQGFNDINSPIENEGGFIFVSTCLPSSWSLLPPTTTTDNIASTSIQQQTLLESPAVHSSKHTTTPITSSSLSLSLQSQTPFITIDATLPPPCFNRSSSRQFSPSLIDPPPRLQLSIAISLKMQLHPNGLRDCGSTNRQNSCRIDSLTNPTNSRDAALIANGMYTSEKAKTASRRYAPSGGLSNVIDLLTLSPCSRKEGEGVPNENVIQTPSLTKAGCSEIQDIPVVRCALNQDRDEDSNHHSNLNIRNTESVGHKSDRVSTGRLQQNDAFQHNGPVLKDGPVLVWTMSHKDIQECSLLGKAATEWMMKLLEIQNRNRFWQRNDSSCETSLRFAFVFDPSSYQSSSMRAIPTPSIPRCSQSPSNLSSRDPNLLPGHLQASSFRKPQASSFRKPQASSFRNQKGSIQATSFNQYDTHPLTHSHISPPFTFNHRCIPPLQILYIARLCFLDAASTLSGTRPHSNMWFNDDSVEMDGYNVIHHPSFKHLLPETHSVTSHGNDLGFSKRFVNMWSRVSDEVLQQLLCDSIAD